MQTYTVNQFRHDVRTPYAWPGGYPTYFVMSDGASLSVAAAKSERRNILEAIKDNDSTSGWLPIGLDVNWEDTTLYCTHTGDQIPSAYGDDGEIPNT